MSWKMIKWHVRMAVRHFSITLSCFASSFSLEKLSRKIVGLEEMLAGSSPVLSARFCLRSIWK